MSNDDIEVAAYLTEAVSDEDDLYWPWWEEDTEQREETIEAAESKHGVKVEPLVRASGVRDRIDKIRYECEDPEALDMLHKLKDELEQISLKSRGE